MTVSTSFNFINRRTSLINTFYTLLFAELFFIDGMETIATCHKIKWLITSCATPWQPFITFVRRITLKILTIITNYIAPIEPTLAFTNRSHPVIFKAENISTLYTEKIVQFVRAFLTGHILVSLVGEFVTEREERYSAIGTSHVRILGFLKYCSTLSVRTCDAVRLHKL